MEWLALFFLLLIPVAWSDIQRRAISNVNVLVIAIFGLVAAGMRRSPFSVDLGEALLAGGLAFVALLPFYVIGWMGAADVKLAAAMGLWLGVHLLLPVWAVSALISIAYSSVLHGPVWLKRYQATETSGGSEASHRRFLPYGAMLCVAAALVTGWKLLA